MSGATGLDTDPPTTTPTGPPAPATGQDAPPPPTTRRVLWLVLSREVSTRLRSKAFKIMTPLFVVALVLGIGAASLFAGGTSTSTVGFLPADATAAAALDAAADGAGVDLRTVTVPDPADARAQVQDGDLDAAVVATGADGLQVVVREELDDVTGALLTAVARGQALDAQITALGGDPAQVQAAMGAAGVHVEALDPADPRHGARIALGVITGILLYISLLIFGPTVAQGVVEEKSSRVVELLLATVKPWQLMAGKVLGIGLVGLSQLVLYAAVAVPMALGTGVLDLPTSVALGSVTWSLLWFLLGFALYALLFAATGALVSRQEDVAGVTTPIIMMIIIPYVVGVSVLPSDPDSGLLDVLSVVPLSAPLIMPMLIAAGTAPGWQIALAVALAAATIAALVRLTGRIYAGAVKRTGSRIRLTDALRNR
ncbi:ABC transporter permease [Frankia sp. CNm7]|uniref:ABC transporter permease n=1 Tax=Frankia nepalensis TaxID=1836974 RepID=A0A937R6G1_9ACTN|nr:ABC transporter permease [Frankia nepalensis]MBL7496931.1 ABC transporter permease [Frankia nepalensis]MBL7508308.1 ABC transporter permease [Frankia nepalensis]MBL7518160.1 ABC transporter permease [Frankia nepalensis]MBL7626136.1 ABC transporter permease [Frankia nepalensis]